MDNYTNLYDWVINEMMRGRYIFTKEDVHAIQLPISNQALQNNLSRLVTRGIIVSPWQNFYVIVPTEYKLRGIVPPTFYIDRLMRFLGRDYYVSLLSAAELNGASHQKTMIFQVTTNGKPIRSGIKNGSRLEFTLRKDIPQTFIQQIKTQTGYMNISNPELTAFDIVAEEQKIGGLSRAAEILAELNETICLDKTKLPLLTYFSCATLQRLGYLLERIAAHQHADDLFALVKLSGKTLRKTPLKQTAAITNDMRADNRWKVIKNYDIDIDEI